MTEQLFKKWKTDPNFRDLIGSHFYQSQKWRTIMLKRGACARKKVTQLMARKKKTWWEEREYNKRPRSSVRDICPLARLQPLMFIEPHITACSSECYVFKYVHLQETFCIQTLTGAFEDLCPWLYETAALVLKRFQGFVLCAIDNTFTEHSTA